MKVGKKTEMDVVGKIMGQSYKKVPKHIVKETLGKLKDYPKTEKSYKHEFKGAD